MLVHRVLPEKGETEVSFFYFILCTVPVCFFSIKVSFPLTYSFHCLSVYALEREGPT